MASYLERYLSGERQQVWDELLARGEQVRAEPLLSDARAVAHETMKRVKANIEVLVTRLLSIGYSFSYQSDPAKTNGSWWGDSYPIYEPPLADVERRLNQLEEKIGPMPRSLRAWYEVVGTINFIGRHEGWPDIEVIDPMVVCPLGDDTIAYIEGEYRDWLLDKAEGSVTDDWPFGIEIAPDYWHKACISGGPAYRVQFPCGAADGKLFHEWHKTTFVNYLRICFRWGGFPGFERVAESERPSEHLAFLTEGLLAL
jgi:hypothetical protein